MRIVLVQTLNLDLTIGQQFKDSTQENLKTDQIDLIGQIAMMIWVVDVNTVI